MDQRKWTQTDVKKKKNLSKTVLWCLNQNLWRYWAPWLRRIACLFGKSWQRSPHGKQWRRLSAKPNEALAPPGPCQPATPDGSFRPAKEPCLSPRKVGRSICNRHFSQAQTDSSYFGPSCRETAHLGLPLCIALTCRGREKRSVAKVGIPAPPLTSSKSWGQLINSSVFQLCLCKMGIILLPTS